MKEIMVTRNNGQLVVSSREVAKNFEKGHRHVLEVIREIIGGMPKNRQTSPMFFETSYTHPQNGQQYPEYLMNRDGFSLLVMGFTGKKAMAWKIKYIEAFNAMERELANKQDSYMIADPVERAKRWIEEEQKRQSLESEVKELAPKAQMADDFIDAGYAITFRDVCKEIGVNERHMGKIFGLIRFAYKQGKKWRPYSETLKQGYAIVKDAYVERARQRIARMFITMDGKAYLKKMVSFYRESGLLDDWSHGINDDYDECMA